VTRAIVVSDIRSEAGGQPGAIEFRELQGEVRGIAFRCPCGCGYQSYLPVAIGERGWQWNGSMEAPSTTPSILQSGLTCKWHGYLTDGEFVSC
jgi:hypothetical protein